MKLNSTCINVLKVVATSLVFFCHCTITTQNVFGYELRGLMKLINTPAWGGVFMFFTISGILAGLGFDIGRYTLDATGVKRYYKNKFQKVLLPTWIFLSLAYIINMQEATVGLETIVMWVTCTFNGGYSGIKAVGATWYVFILMWLYLLTPLFVKFLNKLEKKYPSNESKVLRNLLIFVSVLGLAYRLVGHFYFDLDWYNWLYANVIAAVDLFLIGMIGGRLIDRAEVQDKHNNKIKYILIGSLIAIIVLSRGGIQPLGTLYRYVFPTFYALLTVGIISFYTHSDNRKTNYLMKICDVICPYTFMFYLWHSMILLFIAMKTEFIMAGTLHFFVTLILGFIVTAYVAFLMTKMNTAIIGKHSK